MPFLSANPGFNIGSFHVAWYGVIIASGMLISTILCRTFAKRRNLKGDDMITLALLALPLSIVGARVYYLIFTDVPHTFAQMFEIWNGGIAIYGGIIGGALGIGIFCLIKKQNFFDYCDVITPFLLLSQGIGRWGNYLNQEAFGSRVLDEGMQWFPYAVKIGSPNSLGVEAGYYLATFFYESMLNLIGFAILFTLLLKTKKRGLVAAGYCIYYGIVRALIEPLRMDSLLMGNIEASFIVSLLIIIFGLLMLLYMFWLNKYFDLRQVIKTGFNKVFRRKKTAVAGSDAPVAPTPEIPTETKPENTVSPPEEKTKPEENNNLENMP